MAIITPTGYQRNFVNGHFIRRAQQSGVLVYVREVGMDITKLKVGQKVWMQSGNQFWQATISKITEVYMEVEPVVAEAERGFAIRFDRDGKQRIWERFTNLKDYSVAHIRDWPFGVYGWVDAWAPYRPMCGEGTIPYELVEQGPTAEGIYGEMG